MRGYYITEYIKPDELEVNHDVPEPTPKKPTDIIVDVHAAGLNYFDILQVQGKYQSQPPFPWVAGCEFAGVVASDAPIPKDCPFKAGDRVFGAGQGAFGDRLACDWHLLVRMPDEMSFEEAASLSVTWPTSYAALVSRAEVKPGEWVLVHAAAGGVGLAAVQIAKALGAKVIATAGSAEKLDVCKKYGGADEALNYGDPSWQKEVMRITKGKGVDVVYDPVGLVQKSLKVIAWKGRILVIGFAAGNIEKIPMNLVLLKNISLVGVHWGAYWTKEPSHVGTVWAALMDLYHSGKLKPVIYSEVFPFDSLAKGLAAIAQRDTWGKAIMSVKADSAERSAAPPKAKL